mmetsp:Transcript_9935/g.9611  ORF Transcript_9935/g.9611 Transcript_9935/m.9611 type:complete len:267 (-) Transcript_9935:261-1061(-)
MMEHDTSFMSSLKEYHQSPQEQEEAWRRSRSTTGSNYYTSCDRNDDEMDGDDDQPTLTLPSHLPRVSSSTTTTTIDACCDDDDDCTGFVYQRPLLVNKSCMDVKHDMGGVTVSVILLFNLALAHQLQSATSPTQPCAPKKNVRVLQQARHLYALVSHIHHVDYYIQHSQQQSQQQQQDEDSAEEEEDDDAMKTTPHFVDNSDDDDDDSVINDTTQRRNTNTAHRNTTTGTSNSSNDYNNRSIIVLLRFTMIVSNNLGDIHRVTGKT